MHSDPAVCYFAAQFACRQIMLRDDDVVLRGSQPSLKGEKFTVKLRMKKRTNECWGSAKEA